MNNADPGDVLWMLAQPIKEHDRMPDDGEPYAGDAAYQEDELYCDYCELEGHTFRSCPRRDDRVETK